MCLYVCARSTHSSPVYIVIGPLLQNDRDNRIRYITHVRSYNRPTFLESQRPSSARRPRVRLLCVRFVKSTSRLRAPKPITRSLGAVKTTAFTQVPRPRQSFSRRSVGRGKKRRDTHTKIPRKQYVADDDSLVTTADAV